MLWCVAGRRCGMGFGQEGPIIKPRFCPQERANIPPISSYLFAVQPQKLAHCVIQIGVLKIQVSIMR